MTSTVADRASGRLPRAISRLPSHWPLTALLAGFPLWWILGLAEFAPIIFAVPMLYDLVRRGRRVRLPRGFVVWALFLAWVAVGVLVLWADAPDAVPGGDGTRVLLFAFRASWYVACTIILLWLGNTPTAAAPFRLVTGLLGFMFVITTAGGLVGVLAPELELRSALELVLPRSVAGIDFVRSMVHLETADIQAVLGRPEARPKAPFAFANSWGSNFSLFLPFFLVSWWTHGKRWQRLATPLLLVSASVPVVYSLNRGLWFSLAVGALLFLLLRLRRGKPVALIVCATLIGVAALGVAASPLGDMLQERLDNPHSNDRRSQLLQQTFSSTAEGSPVVGFGSTRDVQGSFASIAGGATPDCPACGVPPLGTQGHFWMVLFSQGLVGAGLFLTFLAISAARAWQCRTDAQVVCSFVLLFLGLQLATYDTLGMPMVTVMIAIALVWRERSEAGEMSRTVGQTVHTMRRYAVPTLAVVILGAMVGGALASSSPQQYSAGMSILLPPSPVYLASDALDDGRRRETTVDTEATLALADRSLRQVRSAMAEPTSLADVRSRTTVTASPNTRVLHLTVRADDARTARRQVTAMVRSYLATRERYLEQRRRQTLELIAEKRSQLEASDLVRPTGSGSEFRSVTSLDTRRGALQLLDTAATMILLSPTSAGEVIREDSPTPVRRQPEVAIASGAATGLAAGALAATFGLRLPTISWRRRRMSTPTAAGPESRPRHRREDRSHADSTSVDVVVATHNRPELLRVALDAIWNQTYDGVITCYVVFDQSEPDLSLERAAAHRQITVMTNRRRPGLAGARNAGILAGHGELVGFCDDDDEWLPTKLAEQVTALRASDVPTSVTGINVLYADRTVARVPSPSQMTVQNLARNRVMEAHPSTVVVRREALVKQIGLVDEEIPGSFGEDYDWILRAAQVGGFAVVEQPLVNVRWGQSLFSGRWETIVSAIDYWLAKHELFQQDPVALGRIYGQRAFALAALGRRREALLTAAKSARRSPGERRAYLAVAVALGLVSAERLMAMANRRGRGI